MKLYYIEERDGDSLMGAAHVAPAKFDGQPMQFCDPAEATQECQRLNARANRSTYVVREGVAS